MSAACLLDARGEDAIIAMICNGSTQSEIARDVGVAASTVNVWLHANPERSARARDAMETSAEAWLDRGLDALNGARPDNAEIARARAIEQHCARRAAIRNPKYRDKVQQEISGPGGGAIQTEARIDVSGLTPEQLRALAGIKLPSE